MNTNKQDAVTTYYDSVATLIRCCCIGQRSFPQLRYSKIFLTFQKTFLLYSGIRFQYGVLRWTAIDHEHVNDTVAVVNNLKIVLHRNKRVCGKGITTCYLVAWQHLLEYILYTVVSEWVYTAMKQHTRRCCTYILFDGVVLLTESFATIVGSECTSHQMLHD